MTNHMKEHGEYCSRLINYDLQVDEYGIPDFIAYSGGDGPQQLIGFCPWCGIGLPQSRRHDWYDNLEAMGLDPHEDQIPPAYLTDEWRKPPPS